MPRFYRSPLWKHLITSRDPNDFRVVTDLTRLASSRSGRFELGAPATFDAVVPSDDFRVYFPTNDQFARAEWDPPFTDDPADFPRLAEGFRLMFSFRRDYGGDNFTDPNDYPWTIRHAGPVLEVRDNADPSRRMTSFTAFDPWGYLYQRPVRRNDKNLTAPDPDINPMPGEMGTVFEAGTTGDAIICELLRRTIEEDGHCYIDAGTAFGGTSDYAGTIETTDTFVDPVTFPRGMTVGEAWAQVMDTGNLYIILKPIWDPINRPGYCAELYILTQFDGLGYFEAWPNFRFDRTGRSIIEIERGYDGRERANRLRAFSGGTGAQSNPWTGRFNDLATGGAAFPESSYSDAASASRYGASWDQPTYVRVLSHERVSEQARVDLIRRRVGERALRFSPTPEFSPRPFQDYVPGTVINYYNSHRLRQEEWWLPIGFNDAEVFPRIFGYTIELSDDSLEKVRDIDVEWLP